MLKAFISDALRLARGGLPDSDAKCQDMSDDEGISIMSGFMRMSPRLFVLRGMHCCLLACLLVGLGFLNAKDVFAQSKTFNHAVIYGGLSDSLLPTVATSYDVLVVGSVKYGQVQKIKAINPKIIILKYVHSIGIYSNSSDYAVVKGKGTWFVRDRASGGRLVAKPYGWYLMDVSNKEWQTYKASAIARSVESGFDGVFLDDFWDRYVAKFVVDGTAASGTPTDKVVADWNKSMIQFLNSLKAVYPKLIFINGAFEGYLPYVDGCMAESFVHSNWNSDSFFHNPSTYLRSLAQVANLSKYGKTILAQSGSKNDGTGSVNDVFGYCNGSYLLVYNDKTTFYFVPRDNYYFTGLAYFPRVSLGTPLGDYYTYYEGPLPLNLIPNSDFKAGFKGWGIVGAPSLSVLGSANTVSFAGNATRHDTITSGCIPASPNTKYLISARCKADSNEPGSAPYRKLGIVVNYLDVNKKYLGSTGSLQFDPGKYDWLPFEAETVSPAGTAYFKIQIGFLGDGKGTGTVSDIGFRIATPRARVLRRDFELGSVLVNYGNKDYAVAGQTIKAHQGVILVPKASVGRGLDIMDSVRRVLSGVPARLHIASFTASNPAQEASPGVSFSSP